MSITRKIFFYSIGITVAVISLVLGYFLLMLSPLYADYLSSSRLNDIKAIQTAQANGTFDSTQKQFNSSGLNFVSLSLPHNSYTFTVSLPQGEVEIELTDPHFRTFIDGASELIRYTDDAEELDIDVTNEKFETLFTDLSSYLGTQFNGDFLEENNFFKIKSHSFSTLDNTYSLEDAKILQNGSTGIIMESQVSDSFSYYTSYMGIADNNNTYYFTLGTAATPKLEELQPVILQSLPVIIVLSILLLLIAVTLASKMFIAPLNRITNITQQMRNNTYTPSDQQNQKVDHDEFHQLEELLITLYTELQKTLDHLQITNDELEQKQQQQQLFMMASSHQLKTPIAATLLLIEGMIDQVGKYADTKTYLPKVKAELIDMRTTIDEILESNRTVIIEESSYVPVDVAQMFDAILQKHQVLVKEKELQINMKITDYQIRTEEHFFYKIIDNIITNTINYTPAGNRINIWCDSAETIYIENFGITIDETLLPNIFDPFVRQTSEIKGHGLGLYIVAHYCKLLNFNVEIKNNPSTNSVLTVIKKDV